ncbi:mitotic spindle checkpoint protein Bub3 [Maudiozyma exigua]|uniref:Mitotic spindle checkpoint protein Bub3 n=1 Tax=Maudiozyma exigua TaxID=34358 RepID=A0A9P7BBE5_MAUEX|nr:mitotic spindle checkpoint protein Bub3 [Kazachstania exigua]
MSSSERSSSVEGAAASIPSTGNKNKNSSSRNNNSRNGSKNKKSNNGNSKISKDKNNNDSGSIETVNQRKNRNRRKNNNRTDENKPPRNRRSENSSVREYVKSDKNKENSELSIQRQTQIDQCLHCLGKENFRMFRNGKYVTTYSITFNNNNNPNNALMINTFPKRLNVKFSINVPHDYPRQSLKLSSNKSNSQETSDNVLLNNLINNFNYKARHMDNVKFPIMSQLNYLSQELNILLNSDFKNIDQGRSEFYKQFNNKSFEQTITP